MRCTLVQTPAGWKLVEVTTGRFYGYVRSCGDSAKDRREYQSDLRAMRAEIAERGFYDTERSRT